MSEFIYTSDICPLCGDVGHYHISASTKDHRIKLPWLPTLTWLKCGECAHIFRKEGFTDAGLAELMKQAPPQVALDPFTQRELWTRALAPLVKPGYRVLDAGCGAGAASMVATELGGVVTAVDSREIFVEFLNGLDIRAIQGEFGFGNEALIFDEPFDLIIAADLIEHVSDPKLFLIDLRSMLAKGGTLLLSTPDADSPFFRMFGAGNPYWYEVEHLHTFTFWRLDQLLTDCDLPVLSKQLHNRYLCGIDVLCRHA